MPGLNRNAGPSINYGGNPYNIDPNAKDYASQNYAALTRDMWASWTSNFLPFENDLIGFSMEDPEAIDELISDLNRPKYDTDSQARIRVDKYGMGRGKTTNSLTDEELAERSPDRGDSFVLALAAAKPLLAPVPLEPRNLIPGRSEHSVPIRRSTIAGR